jgi:hypothetical protein
MFEIRLPKFDFLSRHVKLAVWLAIAGVGLWYTVPAVYGVWTRHRLTVQLREGPIDERKQALLQLHDRGVEPFADLMDMLEDPDDAVRVLASDALIWLTPKPPEVIPPLIRALHDANRQVRWNAAYALGEIGTRSAPTLTGGERSAVRALCQATADPSKGVRTAVMCALGQFERKSPAGVAALLEGLEDENGSVQLAAAWALLDIDSQHDMQAIPVIVEGLSSDDRKTRETAMHLVQEFAPRFKKAIPHLYDVPTGDDGQPQGRTADLRNSVGGPIRAT